MNKKSHDLDRLLRSAAAAPSRPLVELDLGMQNRVLSRLRASPVAAGISALTVLCWRGALAACSLAAVAVAVAVLQAPSDSQDPYSEAESVTVEAVGIAAN